MRTSIFIDASNLFYGGEKSLGWKIDYKKLLAYLQEKYEVNRIFYFGGVEIHDFKYDYQKDETVPIAKLESYLLDLIKNKRKANCDVDMAFHLMKEKDNFDRAIVLSGDGDFLPVLKHLNKECGKEILIMARGPRTAKEIKQFAGDKFLDFTRLQHKLKYLD